MAAEAKDNKAVAEQGVTDILYRMEETGVVWVGLWSGKDSDFDLFNCGIWDQARHLCGVYHEKQPYLIHVKEDGMEQKIGKYLGGREFEWAAPTECVKTLHYLTMQTKDTMYLVRVTEDLHMFLGKFDGKEIEWSDCGEVPDSKHLVNFSYKGDAYLFRASADGKCQVGKFEGGVKFHWYDPIQLEDPSVYSSHSVGENGGIHKINFDRYSNFGEYDGAGSFIWHACGQWSTHQYTISFKHKGKQQKLSLLPDGLAWVGEYQGKNTMDWYDTAKYPPRPVHANPFQKEYSRRYKCPKWY